MNSVKVVVDRIEADAAVLLAGSDEIIVPLKLLPEGTKEGTVLQLELSIDASETEKRRREIKERIERLRRE